MMLYQRVTHIFIVNYLKSSIKLAAKLSDI